jgi:hypothetical protein
MQNKPMKIKWNWGTGIFLASAAFMLMIIIFVVFMFRNDEDLVEKDYYPKALEYQQQINKAENSSGLSEKVKIEYEPGRIVLTFPSIFEPDSLGGTIYFYRPSSKQGDVTIKIHPDSLSQMILPDRGLIRGKYLVKIDYSYKGKGYFQQESLIIP